MFALERVHDWDSAHFFHIARQRPGAYGAVWIAGEHILRVGTEACLERLSLAVVALRARKCFERRL